MIIYVFAIALLCLIGGKPYLRGFNSNYLTKMSTDAVRGVFILSVFHDGAQELYRCGHAGP